jgi:hypothetical protein
MAATRPQFAQIRRLRQLAFPFVTAGWIRLPSSLKKGTIRAALPPRRDSAAQPSLRNRPLAMNGRYFMLDSPGRADSRAFCGTVRAARKPATCRLLNKWDAPR